MVELGRGSVSGGRPVAVAFAGVSVDGEGAAADGRVKLAVFLLGEVVDNNPACAGSADAVTGLLFRRLCSGTWLPGSSLADGGGAGSGAGGHAPCCLLVAGDRSLSIG